MTIVEEPAAVREAHAALKVEMAMIDTIAGMLNIPLDIVERLSEAPASEVQAIATAGGVPYAGALLLHRHHGIRRELSALWMRECSIAVTVEEAAA